MSRNIPIHAVSLQKLDEVLERIKALTSEDDYQIVHTLVTSYRYLFEAYHASRQSITKLLRMVFGQKTEKYIPKPSSGSEDQGAGEASQQDGTGTASSKRKKGHGRNGADKYPGAHRVSVSHEKLKAGEPCPECPRGKLYPLNRPAVLLSLYSRAPVDATVYELEQLRCNGCQQVFTAQAPPEAGSRKYAQSAAVMMALLKYGSGMPFFRLAALQRSLGIPLPESTQWDVVSGLAQELKPIWKSLLSQAANAPVLHNDDTTAQILQRTRELQTLSQEDRKRGRTGTFTTAVMAQTAEGRIALYFTGARHAGENLNLLFGHRDPGRPPPVQMCDALSRNIPADYQVILCNCLTHCRRTFFELLSSFPEETQHVLTLLKQIYQHEQQAQEQQLDDHQRLSYHQQHSAPIMNELNAWIKQQQKARAVEPNSSLGKAFAYTQNHWDSLVQFLKTPGAPIDNSICEQVIKRFVLFRKSSLFYKTHAGAAVGDLFMSLIHTCELNQVNPFAYLTTLARNPQLIAEAPERWMPWNYQQTLEQPSAHTVA